MRVLFVAPYVAVAHPRAAVRVGEGAGAPGLPGPPGGGAASRGSGPRRPERVRRRARPPRCSRSSRWQTLANAASALPSSLPIQAAYARQPAAEARIRALAASGGFDVVHVEHLRGALLVPSPGPVPTVYDGVDCITRLFEQTLRLAPGLAQRAMARLDVGRTRRFEASLSRRFDRMIASSEAEAPRLPRPRPGRRSRLRDRAAQRRRPRRGRPGPRPTTAARCSSPGS